MPCACAVEATSTAAPINIDRTTTQIPRSRWRSHRVTVISARNLHMAQPRPHANGSSKCAAAESLQKGFFMAVSVYVRRLTLALFLSVIALTLPVRADVLEKTMTAGGLTVHYKVVLPSGYDATKTYPAIIALGGGPQTMNTVDAVLNRNLRAEAEKRGYIV